MPWLLAGLLACQGTRPTPTPAEPTTAPPVPSPTAAGPITPTAGPAATATSASGLAGLVIAASDVAGVPDEPLPDQMVLAVAVERADAVLGPGTSGLPDGELRFLKADLPAPHPALSVTLSDPAGNYALALPPGEYLLCLADSDVTPPGFPARTRGCGRADVPAGPMRRVDISSGFGEILLVVP